MYSGRDASNRKRDDRVAKCHTLGKSGLESHQAAATRDPPAQFKHHRQQGRYRNEPAKTSQ